MEFFTISQDGEHYALQLNRRYIVTLYRESAPTKVSSPSSPFLNILPSRRVRTSLLVFSTFGTMHSGTRAILGRHNHSFLKPKFCYPSLTAIRFSTTSNNIFQFFHTQNRLGIAPTPFSRRHQHQPHMSDSFDLDLENFTHPAILKLNGAWWFHELNEECFPGQTFGLRVNRVLHHEKSEFQDILIFELLTFGNVLVLNGIVQCTEKDEFSYQELITHVPIMSHPYPKKVLVIGGGDCGVVRELVKHLGKGVEEITMVEIDRKVIELSVRFLPDMAKFHDHPKVNIEIADGFQFLKDLSSQEEKGKYDIIITDSLDPEGPAEEFFQVNYFDLLKSAVKQDGIVIMQSSENIWLNLTYLSSLKEKAQQVFSTVEYCQCYMPSYTSGQLGLIVATMDKSKNLTKPLRTLLADQEEKMFKYYSAAVHESAFVLPTWADRALR